MADLISFHPSAVDLISFGLKSLEKLERYIKDHVDRNHDLQALCPQITELVLALKPLSQIVGTQQVYDVKVALVSGELVSFSCRIDALDTLLRELAVPAGKRLFKRAKPQVDSPLHTQTVLNRLPGVVSDIGSTVELSHSVLRLPIALLDLRTNPAVRSILRASHDRLKNDVSDIWETAICGWLGVQRYAINYKPRHEAYIAFESPPGDWLIKSQTFQEWERDSRGILWLHGIPGSGKTVIFSAIYEHIQVEASAANVMAYVYSSLEDPALRTFGNLLRNVIFQLMKQDASVASRVEVLFNEHRDGTEVPRLHDLEMALLDSLSSTTKKVFLLVDALDECPEVRKLLAFFKELSTSCTSLHVFITSRREAEIGRLVRYAGVVTHEVFMQVDRVNEDIKVYIEAYISKDYMLDGLPEALKVEVRNALMNEANGRFRGVSRQLETLRKCRRGPDVREWMRNLSVLLEESNERTAS